MSNEGAHTQTHTHTAGDTHTHTHTHTHTAAITSAPLTLLHQQDGHPDQHSPVHRVLHLSKVCGCVCGSEQIASECEEKIPKSGFLQVRVRLTVSIHQRSSAKSLLQLRGYWQRGWRGSWQHGQGACSGLVLQSKRTVEGVQSLHSARVAAALLF